MNLEDIRTWPPAESRIHNKMSSSTQRKQSEGYKANYGDTAKDPEVVRHPGSSTGFQQKEQRGLERGEQSSKTYNRIPSIAEAAEHSHHESQYESSPSIAEMAESHVGGGEPVPFQASSEGTASRSVAEQADIDRQIAEEESRKNVLKSPSVEGREYGDQQASLNKGDVHQVPGAAESLGASILPEASQRASAPDRQAQSETQEYQRFEKSGEPAFVSKDTEAVTKDRPSAYQEQQEQFRTLPQQPETTSQNQPLNRAEIGQGFALGPTENRTEQPKGKQIPICSEGTTQKYGTEGLQQQQQPQQQKQSEEKIQSINEMQPGHQKGSLSESSRYGEEPEHLKSYSAGLSPDEQARLFYAQGESTFEKQQYQQQHQKLFSPGEESPEHMQTQQRPEQQGQPYAEGRTLEEGEKSGQQSPCSVPVSVQTAPQMGPMVTEFAKMQFPRERFEEPSETTQKKGIKEQPGSKPIGIGAESGRPVEYEYLSHPNDVQFHSWGPTKQKAFENMASCMFNYLANVEQVHADPKYDFQFKVIGEDDKELLYKFLDELLFRFNARKQIICKQVSINQLGVDEDGSYRLVATGYGEPYNMEKHGSGTDIKAITIPSLQIKEQPERTEAFVIVDI